MEDTPCIAARRKREKLVVSQMVAIYCAGHHPAASRTKTAHCGGAICPDCAELDRFAVARTQRCRKMETKTSCNKCEHHCYSPQMQQRIRDVMRYAGPRMLYHHPIAAIRHMLGK